MAAFRAALLLLSVLIGHHASIVHGVNPCELTSGFYVNLDFTENYGPGDHLPTLGEERSVSVIFGTVRQASDPKTNETIVLRIFNNTNNLFFNKTAFDAVREYFQLSVRSGVGYISLKQGIDREIMDIRVSSFPGTTGIGVTIDFGIECLPDTGIARNLTARVTINDVNDNSPVFYNTSTNLVQTVYAGFIRENTPTGVLQFLGAQARDLDDASNAVVTISVLNDTYLQTREIGSDVRLYTNRPLDYESFGVSSPNISVLVIAKDSPANASMALTSTATIVFSVLDEDDLPPKFIVSGCTLYLSVCLNPTYTSSIISNVNASGPLAIQPGPILALDQDSLNFSTRYSIVAGNFSSSFFIDEITGQVAQLAPIDRQVAATVTLVIRASQFTTRTDVTNNNLYDTAVLIISVDAQDTFAPTLSFNMPSDQLTVTENSPIGTLVMNTTGEIFKLIVSDRDLLPSDPPRKYQYTVTNTALFKVNDDGTVAVNYVLIDYESLPADKQINLTVTATEIDSPRANLTGTVSFSVSVLDMNDNSPVFQALNYSFVIAEGPGSRPVGQVRATDADSGVRGTAGLRYSIVEGNTTIFAINESTGEISATGNLVRNEVFVLTVRARDSEPQASLVRTADVAVQITVTRMYNLPPYYSAPVYSVSVSEDTPVGSVVGSFPAADPEGDIIRYSLLNQTVSSAFNYTSDGSLTVAAPLDRESPIVPYHSVFVSAQDSLGNRTAVTEIRVVLLDSNDNDPVISVVPTNFSVAENTFPAIIVTINATDADLAENALIRFFVSEATNSFAITQTTNTTGFASAQLQLAKALDYEARAVHYVTVTARDFGLTARSATVTLTINVEDRDDMAPFFPVRYFSGSVAENSNNAYVTTVAAIDGDSFSNVTYRLVNESVPFRINATSGEIFTTSGIDYESNQSYVLIVSTDQSSLTITDASRLSATVSIAITDVNDNRPVLSAPAMSVLETQPIGATVGNVSVSDADSGVNAMVQFSIAKAIPADGLSFFLIDSRTGSIRLRNSLLRNRSNSVYNLTVTASDYGTPSFSSSTSVIINVSRATQSPVVQPATWVANISMLMPVGTQVVLMSATDADTVASFNSPLLFSLAGLYKGPTYFAINSTTGSITLQRNLSLDIDTEYILYVVATDPSGLTGTSTITVSVSRNLHAPVINPAYQNFSISEEQVLGTSIGASFTTSDADLQAPYNTWQYVLTSNQSDALNYFMIDANTGQIMAKRSLVDSTTKLFFLSVTAQDKGTPSLSSTAALVQVNLVTNNGFPQFTNSQYNIEVPGSATNLPVASIIATDAESPVLSYALYGTYASLFSHNGTNLIAVGGFNNPAVPIRFFIILEASDTAKPPKSNRTQVNVVILRNDFTPDFNSSSYVFTINETQQLGQVFDTVSGYDLDPNSPENTVEFFSENPLIGITATGGVYLQQDILTRTETSFNITIGIRDQGYPARNNTIPLTLNVRRNTAAPIFYLASTTINIDMTRAIGSIGRVFANDSDSVFGSIITYSLIGDSDSSTYFSVNSATGEISLISASIATQTATQYQLRILAADNGSPQKTAQALITVVINRNLYPPEFLNSTGLSLTLAETQSLGDVLSVLTGRDNDTQAPYNEFTFSLVGNGSATTYFDVTPTGSIFLKRSLLLDASASTSYQLAFAIQDKATPSKSGLNLYYLNVTVVRNLNTPIITSEITIVSLNRTATVGTNVFRITATDADVSPFNTLTYSLLGDASSLAFFTINSTSGEVTTRELISNTNQTTFYLSIMVKDSGNPPKTNVTLVTVQVDRNLFAPIIYIPTAPGYADNVSVIETSTVDSLLFTVYANDSDPFPPYNSIRYKLLGSGLAQSYFYVVENTGEVRLRASLLLDAAKTTSYQLTIGVMDGSSPPKDGTSNVSITVNVARNLNAPAFNQSLYRYNVARTAALNTFVGQVTAVDRDWSTTFSSLTYYLISDGYADGSHRFNVSTDGQIFVAANLSLDSAVVNYSLVLGVRDAGVPPMTATTLVLLDLERNLNTPVSYQQVFTVKETESPGNQIGALNSTDADPSGEPASNLVYRMTAASASSEAGRLFFLTLDGRLYIQSPLTSTTAMSFTIQYTTFDSGVSGSKESAVSQITINVLRNQFAPELTNLPATLTLERNSSIGRVLMTATATDNDSTVTGNPAEYSQLTYSIIGDGSAPLYFFINPISGTVNLTRALTGLETSFQLRIRVSDGGYPSKMSESTLTITVSRNLFAPVLNSQVNGTIFQFSVIGSNTGALITAVDSDTEPGYSNVTYKIVPNDYFTINSTTGQVTTIASLLEVGQPALNVTVYAEDLGTPPLQSESVILTITILSNQASPQWVGAPTGPITLNASVVNGVILQSLRVTDADSQNFYNQIRVEVIGDYRTKLLFKAETPYAQNSTGLDVLISVADQILNDSASEYFLQLRAYDSNACSSYSTPSACEATQRFTDLNLILRVNRNLQTPKWSHSSALNIALLETQALNQVVLTLNATEDSTCVTSAGVTNLCLNDPGVFSQITISLQAPSTYATDYFRFYSDASTGQGFLSIQKPLYDGFRNVSNVVLNLVATDGGGLNVAGSVNITILRNNFAPTVPANYSIVINETLPVGSSLPLTIPGADADTNPPFNMLSYSIVGSSSALIFFDVATNGTLYLRQSVAVETQAVYSFEVLVQDGGMPPLSATSYVTVTVNRNLNAPEWVLPNVTVTNLAMAEDRGPGYLVYTLEATDKDTVGTSGQVRYRLEGLENDTAKQCFFVNSVSGQVLLQSSLLASPCMGTTFTLNVTAYDLGTPEKSTLTRTLSISTQRNLYSPYFLLTNPTNVSIDYLALPTSNVTQILARDDDIVVPFNTITYSLIGDDQATNFFGIDPSTGVVTVTGNFNATTQTVFSLRVRIADGGFIPKANVTILTVNVYRSLQPPVFSPVTYSINITERQPAGNLGISVSATDGDPTAPNNVIAYSIASVLPAEAAPFFSINSANGALSINRVLTGLNFSVSNVTLMVNAVDGGYPALTSSPMAAVYVTITRVPKPAQMTQQNLSIRLEEVANIGFIFCCSFNVTTPDTYDPIQFSIASSSDLATLNEFFYLDPLHGLLAVKKLLTAPANFTALTFAIEAKDSRWQAMHYVTLTVVRDAGSPFLSISGRPASETVFGTVNVTDLNAAGVSIGTILANDTFRGTPVFSIIGSYPSNFLFNLTVNGSLATVVTSRSFVDNPLKQSTYFIQVQVYDSYYPKQVYQRTFSLNVAWSPGSLSIASPVGGTSSIVVWEKSPLGSSINASIRVSQTAGIGAIQYSLLDDPAATNFFFIDPLTGDIRVKQVLTASGISLFNLTVQVTDSLQPTPNIALINLTVTIRRDSSPTIFSPIPTSPVNISSNLTVGSPVATVNAVDGDSSGPGNGTVYYTLIGKDTATTYFKINPVTGAVTLNQSLSGDTRTYYDLEVKAYTPDYPDNGNTTVIRVFVNRNLNAPVFTQPSTATVSINVNERSELGSLAYKFTATDLDGDAITYSFNGTSDAATYFYLDSSSGALMVKANLLSLLSSTMTITVTATDNGTPTPQSASVTAQLSIIRDVSAPVVDLNATKTFVNVSEKTTVGTTIGGVFAFDPDRNGTAGGLTYELIGTPPSNIFFDVNSTNGAITLKSSLMGDTTVNYTVVVRVKEASSGKYTDQAIVISVDRNPGWPVFYPGSRSMNVLVNARVGSLLLTAFANDTDSGDTIRYSIKEAGLTSYFYVNPVTGGLFLIGNLTGLSALVNLTLVATDNGTIPKATESVVSFTIVRSAGSIVFNPPTIVATLNSYNYTSLTLPASIGISVNATMNDSVGQLRYRLIGVYPANAFFEIDQVTGEIRLIRQLDRVSTLNLPGLSLQVTAYNTLFPEVLGFGFVNFTISHNKDKPVIYDTDTSRTVSIELSLGSVLFSVNASDPSGDTIRFNMTDPSGRLYLDPVTGVIYLKQPLAGSSGSIEATVTACDTNSVQLCSSPITYTVTIDNSTSIPRFTNLPNSINMTAFRSVGDVLYTAVATLNLKTSVSIRYSVSGIVPAPSFFQVNAVTGEITLNRSLELDSNLQYNLVLNAYDNDLSPSIRGSSTGTLTILVIRNSNPPMISGNLTTGSVTIDQAQPVGVSFFKVNASDADGDKLIFSLLSWSNLFYIDPVNGEVSLRQSVLTRSELNYSLNVSVSDGRFPAQIVYFELNVSVTRDLSPPTSAQANYTARITENAAIGSVVVFLNVTDADLRGSLVYNIRGLYPAETFFAVNSSGYVTVRDLLYKDVDRRGSYWIIIGVYDSLRPDRVTTLTVSVEVERNFTGPVVLQNVYNRQICTSLPTGSVVLAGADLNISRVSGTVLTFSISSADSSFSSNFSLNPSTGDITVLGSLKAWDGLSSAVISVKDQYGRTEQGLGLVRVTISSYNITTPPRVVLPTDQILSNVANPLDGLWDSVPVNTTAFSVTIYNDQLNGTSDAVRNSLMSSYSASILGSTLAASFFKIVKRPTLDCGTGPGCPYQSFDIQVARSLTEDRSLEAWANFTIAFLFNCDINQSPALTTAFSLRILRNNDSASYNPSTVSISVSAVLEIGTRLPISVSIVDTTKPPFQPPYYCDIVSVPGGASAATIKTFIYLDPATCRDFYAIKPLNTWSGGNSINFSISLNENWPSGISIARPYALNVTLTFASSTWPAEFSPSVLSVNITDTTPVGTGIARLNLTDRDRMGDLMYSLQALSTGAGVFFGIRNVSSTNISVEVELYIINFLRKDVLEQYQVSLTGYDSAYPKDMTVANVTINVRRNVGYPSVLSAPYSRTIGPKWIIGTAVVTVSATDTVDNDTVTYSLNGSATDNQFFFVQPYTGQIVLKESLQLTTISTFSLSIVATDSGVPRREVSTIVTINILRNESVTPVFGIVPAQYSINVSENAAVNTSVLFVNATSQKSPELIRYVALGDGLATDYFQVNNMTADITVKSALTAETITRMILRVQAFSLADLAETNTATVTISVIRNEFPPVFLSSEFNVTVGETTEIGTNIYNMSATDRDAGGVITYTLQPNTTNDEFFFINAKTGAVYLKTSLMKTSMGLFSLIISATDSGVVPRTTTVRLNVLVPRDAFVLVFNTTSVAVSINYTQTVGAVFYKAVPFDINSTSSYEFRISNADNFFFGINSTTGEVYVAKSLLLDTLSLTQYQINISCFETLHPQNVAMMVLTVNVNRNLYGPQFNQSLYGFSILELSAIGTTLGPVRATDMDVGFGKLEVIRHSIQNDSGNPALSYFYINEVTGMLFLERSMDGITEDFFNFTVLATDSGPSPQTASTVVSIAIVKQPRPVVDLTQNFFVNISENQPVGSSVYQIRFNNTPSGITYEATGMGSAPYFFSTNATGAVIVNRNLKEELVTNYNLTLSLYYATSPSRRTTVNIVINVRRNENAPVFLSTFYLFRVRPSLPIGSRVGNVSATDADSPRLSYQLSGSADCQSHFYVNSENGDIILKEVLNGSLMADYYFNCTISASDNTLPSPKTTTISAFLVLQVDTKPVWSKPNGAPIYLTVSETISVGSIINLPAIYPLFANDSDMLGSMSYSVIGNYPVNLFFSYNQTLSAVTLIRSLLTDTQNTASYTLILEAYDSMYRTSASQITIVLNVSRNANKPTFEYPAYVVNVLEGVPLGTVLNVATPAGVVIKATDGDNETITYSLSSSVPSDLDYFYLQPENARLLVKSKLQDTAKSLFQFTLTATDSRGGQGFSNLTIAVTRNLSRPIYPESFINITVSENMPIGAIVYDLNATAAVLPDEIRYRLEGDSLVMRLFQVDNITGVLSLSQTLSGSTFTEIDVRVVAYSRISVTVGTELSSLALLRITILRNQNAPVFNPKMYTATVYDGVAVNALVVTLVATDADNDSLTYSMSGGAEALKYFYVVRTTGQIRVADTIPRFDNQTYEFNVTVSDNRIQEKTDVATVRITASKDASLPFFLQPTNGTTFELRIQVDQAPLVAITKVVADRLNRSQPMVYTTTGVYPANMLFQINVTGEIYLAKSLLLDNLKISVYTLLVETYDPISPRAIGRLNITIIVDLNPYAPVFTQRVFTGTVNEFANPGTQVLQLNATDRIATDVLAYSLASSVDTEIQRLFYVNSETGAITVRSSLRPNITAQNYTFQVQVSDGGKSDSAFATIIVSRNLYYPVFNTLPINVSNVDETFSVGYIIYNNINVTDADNAGAISLELTGIDTATEYFSLQMSSGIGAIRIAKSLLLDSSDTFQYKLRIVAVEAGAPHMPTTATITVNVNRNINSPVFYGTTSGIYSATVNQYDPIGTFLVRVMASDSDLPNNPRSQVTYSIGNSTDFYINPSTGVITTAAKLTQETYVLQVVASDSYLPRRQSTVIVVAITVNTNRHTPSFRVPIYRVNVSESFPIGMSILQLNATDSDGSSSPFGRVVYGLLGASKDLRYFQVAYSTGVISLKDTLLGAGLAEVRLTAIASDQGEPPRVGNATVIIFVTKDVNATRFNQTELRVTYNEDLAVGSSVVNLTAIDPDATGRIRYLIVGDGLSSSLFTIGEFTGMINLSQSFTIDSGILYTIRVVAYDEADPIQKATALVYVTVVRNRNSPSFVGSLPFSVSITESQVLGITILQINATDPDPGPSGELRYSIVDPASLPTDASSWFYVNPLTGALSVSRTLSLDGRSLNQYNVSIRVSDQGNLPRSVTGLVMINVARNLNKPRFLNSTITVTINESISVGTTITRVVAVDPDPTDNVTYSVVGVPAVYYFDVNSNTGDIFVKYSPGFGTEVLYNLAIVASDGRDPPGTARTEVIIKVIRNANGPVFSSPTYNFTISEYTALSTVIGTISATDGDPPNIPSGTLTYTISLVRSTTGVASLFLLGSRSAALTVASPLWSVPSRPSPTVYTIGIDVTDGSPSPKSNATTVFVTVLRNQFSPVFSTKSVNITVNDLSKLGTFIAQLTATDADSALQPDTNNSRITYFVDPTNSAANAYFYVNPNTGKVTLSQMLVNNPANPDSYVFTVYASDSGVPALNDTASIRVNVDKTASTGTRTLGFVQPEYTVELTENAVIGTNVLTLDVIYQDTDKTVNCNFASGNEGGYFDIVGRNGNKDCQMVTKKVIDREAISRFDLRISVSHSVSVPGRRRRAVSDAMEPLLSRKRRQTYTSYPTVKVLIMVSDTNDNAPLFKYPVYPNRTSTQNKYFAAVDMFAPANTRAITVNATDADLGRNAEVSYAPNAWTTATPPNPPFLLSDADGSVRTAATFNRNSTIKYRFGVIAQDNGLPVRLSSSTELIVNLIQDKNRMILVVPGPNKEPKVTIPSLETIRRTLQTATGQVVLIERVNPRQYLEGSTIRDDPTGTDIWFVCVNPVTYDICVRDDAEPTNAFMTNEAKEKIRNMLNGVVPMETIRAPFGVTTGQLAFKKTSDILYQYGFASDVWAALIAIAAFIILMCIIVIVYCLVRRPRDPRFLAARANPYDIYAASQIGSHVGPVSLAASEINGHGGAKIDDIEEQCLEYNIESVPAQEQITPQEQPEYVQIREPNTSSFINPRFQGMSELVSYH